MAAHVKQKHHAQLSIVVWFSASVAIWPQIQARRSSETATSATGLSSRMSESIFIVAKSVFISRAVPFRRHCPSLSFCFPRTALASHVAMLVCASCLVKLQYSTIPKPKSTSLTMMLAFPGDIVQAPSVRLQCFELSLVRCGSCVCGVGHPLKELASNEEFFHTTVDHCHDECLRRVVLAQYREIMYKYIYIYIYIYIYMSSLALPRDSGVLTTFSSHGSNCFNAALCISQPRGNQL